MLTVIVLSVAIPALFAKSYVHSKFNDVDKSLTLGRSDNISEKLFSPEFIVFYQSSDDATGTYVKLKRNWLAWWEVADTKYTNIQNSTAKSLADSIKKGTISENDFAGAIDFSNIPESSENSAGEITSELESVDATYNVETARTRPNYSDNVLRVNGKDTNITNVGNVHIGFDQKSVYYSKFIITVYDSSGMPFEDLASDGKIYKYDLKSGTETEIYNFNSDKSLTFKTNTDYIIYILNDAEVGKINLETKEKQLGDISSANIDLTSYEAGDVGFTMFSVTSVDDKFAYINFDNGQTKTSLKMDLESMQFTK